MKKLEYVASGLNMTRLRHSLNRNTDAYDIANRLMKNIHTDTHDFSILYNAFIEKNLGEWIIEKFEDSISNLYTDSGGLQMITRGMTITEKEKMQVYKTQMLSDYGMSFDEIPVKLLSDKSTRKDETTRIYDKDMLIPCAKISGQNIKNQLEYFYENKASTKPVIIMQGADADSYRLWIETLLGEIPKEYWKDLTSIASGAASLGNGHLQDIQRVYYCKYALEYLNVDHIHLLGMGSHRRIMPCLMMYENLFEGCKISYDSTRHTCAGIFGYFYLPDGTMLTIRRDINKNYREILEILKEFIGKDISLEDFYDCMNMAPVEYYKKYGNNNCTIFYSSFCLISIENFVKNVDKYFHNPTFSNIEPFSKKDTPIILALKNVKNEQDYNSWEKEAINHIKCKKIKEDAPMTLESFL